MSVSKSRSPSRWFLKGRLADGSPWTIPIRDSRFLIGRSADCSLILDSMEVSRRHASISTEAGELYINDLGSQNGTFLNGSTVDSGRLLENRDILKIGNHEFMVCETEQQRVEAVKTLVDERGNSRFADRFGLSVREEEILYLLIRGDSMQEIARKLYISPGTAKNHVLKIYKKTGCHSKIEIANAYRGYAE